MLLHIGSCFLAVVVGYPVTVIGDYMIHRYIWHGRWSIVRRGPISFWLFPAFVHHMVAHHSHAEKAPDAFLAGEEVPADLLRRMESRFEGQRLAYHALQCSGHGLTIKTWLCVAHYYSLYLFTPWPIAVLMAWLLLGPTATFIVAVLPSVAVFTQINHRFYHMDERARKRHTPKLLRWFFLSREFSRLAADHQSHHYDRRFSDNHYGVLPFARLILRPLLGRH